MEQWKEIPHFDPYSVSDEGRIRNDRTDRIMVLRRNSHGVVQVGLMKGTKQRKRSVPLLVAEAFVPRVILRDDFVIPIHLNGDQSDNRAINLLWRPPWFAQKYARQFQNPRVKVQPVMDMKSGKVYDSPWDAAREYGLLERELVSAIERNTFVWPTFQVFKWF